jgi:hypothetical protein
LLTTCRRGMHKEDGADIFKDMRSISFAFKNVHVRAGFV